MLAVFISIALIMDSTTNFYIANYSSSNTLQLPYNSSTFMKAIFNGYTENYNSTAGINSAIHTTRILTNASIEIIGISLLLIIVYAYSKKDYIVPSLIPFASIISQYVNSFVLRHYCLPYACLSRSTGTSLFVVDFGFAAILLGMFIVLSKKKIHWYIKVYAAGLICFISFILLLYFGLIVDSPYLGIGSLTTITKSMVHYYALLAFLLILSVAFILYKLIAVLYNRRMN
jgi:hypothetical protein